MAKKHCKQVIAPFPQELDRRDFGNWLSGFSDGEGCFRLMDNRRTGVIHRQLCAQFSIGLRSDDLAVLKLIQSYFGCGIVYAENRSYCPHISPHPKSIYRISKTHELINVIIPHFKQFPLHAKKKRDFVLWEEGVNLLYAVMIRPNRSCNGRLQKWTAEELAAFVRIHLSLKKQREYNSNPIQLPPPPPDLFADL